MRFFPFGAALLASAAACSVAPAFAEDDILKVSGAARLRYEAIDGQPRAGFNASDDLVNLRTRIMLETSPGAIRFGAELYDSRVWGAEPGTPVSTNEVNAVELVQLYAIAKNDWATLQAGRFTLNLGARRLVAADDYRNTTNGYTGVRLDLGDARRANATLIYVLPQVRLPDDPASVRDADIAWDRESGDLVLYGAQATAPIGVGALQASYFHLDEKDRADLPTRNRDLDTFGLRWFRDPKAGAWDFDFEGFLQGGAIRASTAPGAALLDVEASFVHAELGYRWDAAWKPRLALEYDRASGDEPGGEYERFDALFGMRRSEIAPAGLYNAVGRANLNALGVRGEIEPSPRWDAFVGVRPLYLASATDAFSTTGVRDATGASGDFAGTQLDSRVRVWIVPDRLRFEGTLVYLAKGRFLDEAPNAPRNGDTFYAALDLTWSF